MSYEPFPNEDPDLDNRLDHDDDDDDEEEVNTTQPFQPGAFSTPYTPGAAYHSGEAHEMTHLPLEQSGQDTDPLLTGDDLDQRLQQTRQGSAWADLIELYPQANKNALEASYEKDKQGNARLAVKMVGRGKGKYFLFTKNAVTRQLRENPKITKELKSYLGKYKAGSFLDPSAENIIAEDNTALQETKRRLSEAQVLKDHLDKQTERKEQEVQELQQLETQLEQINERIDNMENEGGTMMERQMELDRLRREKAKLKRDIEAEKAKTKQFARIAKEKDKAERDVARLERQYNDQKKKRDASEASLNRTKPTYGLEVDAETLERKIEEDQQIFNDENTSPEERREAFERYEENIDHLKRLTEQIQEREQELPLRERVKNIFKKYGWTLQAVALAVGIVLSALALAASKGLKAGTKALGNGLKAIGQKLGSLLPGLIGSIVSYIFKAAGSLLSFLGEHAWLLILAVVAFFMERLLKRRKSK